ncbi:dihydrofolate reductase [Candidatus Saccharibacteria bacterium]|nr:dihydrofolate reductase [Candidatus Saccharibacteria bacterium]
MSFSIIAAIGKNRELGQKGQLIWHIPEDLQFFKSTTMGHPILMGRKTYESLPKMLPGRKHFVVTRHPEQIPEKAQSAGASLEIVPDLSQFITKNKSSSEEIFVIGGGMIYWELMKHCNILYLTEVDADFKEADTFFPEFDKSKYTREVLGKGEHNGLKYTFVRYILNK